MLEVFLFMAAIVHENDQTSDASFKRAASPPHNQQSPSHKIEECNI